MLVWTKVVALKVTEKALAGRLILERWDMVQYPHCWESVVKNRTEMGLGADMERNFLYKNFELWVIRNVCCLECFLSFPF